MKPRLPLLLCLSVFAMPHLAQAQTLSFSSKNPDKPIVVTAEQGLEWQQNEKRFIARGNAQAVQGDMMVIADELTAHYREKAKDKNGKPVEPKPAEDGSDPGGSSEVYRVDALGHVTIKSATETATGTAAVYDFDTAVLVMEGETVTLNTGDGLVTAHRAIQYWSNENVAVAEGDAVALDADPALGRRIKADKLTAYFRDAPTTAPAKGNAKGTVKDSASKKRDLTHLLGDGNVVLTTKSEVIRGERANYNLDTGIAIVEGGVKMTRDNNQLNGGYAVVDVKKNISRLYGSAAEAKGAPGGNDNGAGKSRVKALLAPKPATEPTPSAVPQAPALAAPKDAQDSGAVAPKKGQ